MFRSDMVLIYKVDINITRLMFNLHCNKLEIQVYLLSWNQPKQNGEWFTILV